MRRIDQPERTQAVAWLRQDLERASVPVRVPARVDASPKTVLLTGASGFIGSHVLASLLERKLEVRCLLRGSNVDDVRQRLARAIRRWGADVPPERLQHLDVVLGSCHRERFGLSDDAYLELARATDAVVHFAMSGEYITPYARYRRNWLGCLHQLIDLCGAERPKSFHVAGSFNTHALVDGSDVDRLDTTAWHSGYSAYKLVAMRTITAYAREGAPFVWYDLPLALGDVTAPIEREDYGAFQIMDAFLKLRCIVDFRLQAVTPKVIGDVLAHNVQLGPAQRSLVRPMAHGLFGAVDLQDYFREVGVGKLPIFGSEDKALEAMSPAQRFLIPADFTAIMSRMHPQEPIYPPGYEPPDGAAATALLRANAATWSPLKAASSHA